MLSSGDLLASGIEPRSPALQVDSLPSESAGKPSWHYVETSKDFPGSTSDNQFANSGDIRDSGLIPGSGSTTGVCTGNLLQYSCLENSIDRGAWWTTVLWTTKSQTSLNDSARSKHQ